MSVFSMIKRGRQAAKEHAAKQVEKQAAEAAKTPYKHVPRHAATDAMSAGPASCREEDRPKIMEQNRRRSMLTASGMGMSGTSTPVHVGFPRVNSALSHVSYPAQYASPVVQTMPRAYSYTSVQPGWSHHGGEVVYTPMESSAASLKGKEVERIMVDSGRASRTSSKVSFGPYPIEGVATSGTSGASPVGSSNNSTSSQDDLEMKPVKHSSGAPPARSSGSSSGSNSPRATGEVDYFHRLHPSNPRRISDPSTAKQYMSQARSNYVSQKQGGPRVTSLPPSSAGIPPVPALPAMHFGAPLSHPTISSPSSSSSIATSTAASSATMVPYPVSRGSPPRLPIPEEVAGPIPAKEFDNYLPEIGMAVTAPAPTPAATRPENTRRDSRRSVKTARFTELEPIVSNISEATHRNVSPVSPKHEARATITPTPTYALPTQFDESVLSPPQAPVIPTHQKKGKLSKNPSAKLAKAETTVKKNRWSLRSSKTPVAV
ncbi:hypothetical protein GE09DRAFT_257806 [Coniochaeta sp. 2T2.1]|nr:hypothetical protein GE09DRAFT_257806 [Coniochaeta sp. 2T2.1]